MAAERRWAWGLLLVGAAYANALWGVFQFDDYRVIVGDPDVHSLAAWWQASGGLRPLLKLSYALNWAGPAQTVGFHVFNLAIHALNGALVYRLVRVWGARAAPAVNWSWPAFAAALLFLLHPVHTEAVTYISGRSTALMTAAYLSALLAYADGRRWALGLGLLCFLAAVGIKESALLLPAALGVWDWSLGTPWRKALARQWPFWLAALIAGAWLALRPGYATLATASLTQGSPLENLWTQVGAVARLLRQWLWPVALNIDPEIPRLHAWREVWPQGCALGLALVLISLARRRAPWLSLGLGWAGLHLLPLHVVLPRADIANERQLYWADWGLCLLLALGLMRLGVRWRGPMLAGLAFLLALGTAWRNADYGSEVALWEATARRSPTKARVLNNLGYAYQEAGRIEDARAAYGRAVRLDPDYLKARNNLGRLSVVPAVESKTPRAGQGGAALR